jgi:hypothetical protein
MKANTVVLRSIVILAGLGMLIWAFDLYQTGQGLTAAAIVAIEGLLIVGGVLFERKRYRPQVDLAHGEWQTTGEKFKDPVTGKVMDVVFNPKTGQRDYIEISS